MLPLSLTLQNFLSYQSAQTLDFKSIKLAVLVGNNGAGKSSILEALTWAIWGKARSGADNLINNSADDMFVEYIFESSGSVYKIIRKRTKRKRGKTELFLYSYQKKSDLFKPLSEETLERTQIKINSIVKIPYEIFINSAYLRQGKADEFTNKTAQERKEIIAEILDLELYEKLSKAAREKVIAIKLQIESSKSNIEQINQLLIELPNLENQLINIKKSIVAKSTVLKKLEIQYQKTKEKTEKYQTLEIKIDSLNEKVFDLKMQGQNIKNKLIDLKDQKNSLNQTIKNSKQIFSDYQKLQDLRKKSFELQNKVKQYTILISEKSKIKALKLNLKEKIQELKGLKNCPTCFQKVGNKKARIIALKLIKEFKNNYGKRYLEIASNIKKLGYSSDDLDSINQQINNLSQAEENHQKVKSAAAEINQVSKQIDAQVLEIKQMVKKIKNHENQLQKLEKSQIGLEKYAEINKRIENQISETGSELLDFEREKSGFDGQIKQLVLQEKNLNILEKNTKKFENDLKIYKDLSILFSKKGIQARILEYSLPEIENNTNEILQQLSDGQMSIQLVTQKSKKHEKDSVIETLDIVVKDGYGTRDYSLFSGGEAFRINFALRLALSKFLASKSGTSLRFLVVDEGFGTQDEFGRQQLIECINKIKDDFEKILIVTHMEELKNAFEQRIEVVKETDGSKIVVN